MSHSCPLCWQYCDCDMEDHDQPEPADCTHCCDEPDWDEDEWFYENELQNHPAPRRTTKEPT